MRNDFREIAGYLAIYPQGILLNFPNEEIKRDISVPYSGAFWFRLFILAWILGYTNIALDFWYKAICGRGQIKTFSKKSARRLKEFLLQYERPGYSRVAITCTIPFYVSAEEWALIMKRFRQSLLRSRQACIWRVELQRRQVPHLHLVAFCRGIDDVGDFWQAWYNSCRNLYSSDIQLSSLVGFLKYGFSARFVTGFRWLTYLATHTIKHKKEQLGWHGRQWGVINKQVLSQVYCNEEFEMSQYVMVRVCRALRRMLGYRYLNIDGNGSRLFFGCQAVKRLVEYYHYEEMAAFALL